MQKAKFQFSPDCFFLEPVALTLIPPLARIADPFLSEESALNENARYYNMARLTKTKTLRVVLLLGVSSNSTAVTVNHCKEEF